ncbi:clostripain-related cysteine peptidase [Pseudothermotoga sp.]|nr:clostripain-related cysteine peptidase [Pseudothermotoga sp.]MDW8140645.1 clostripain-related cysteine peptidase [Pseudothermotoga sp.]
MGKYLSYLAVIVLSLFLATCAPTTSPSNGQTDQPNPTNPIDIIADDEIHTVGRISYIDVKVVDSKGSPIPNVGVKFFFQSPRDGNWYAVVDELTKMTTVMTDSNGIAKIAVLPNIQVMNQNFRAYISEPIQIEKYFRVTFKRPNWLFLIWMCADNDPTDPTRDLELPGLVDRSEMLNANQNVSVFAFWDGREKDPQDKILVLDEFGVWKDIYKFSEDFKSGDYYELARWIYVIFSIFESSHRALILWNHGNAWLDNASNTRSFTPQAICYDYTANQNAISTVELRVVLQAYNSVNPPGPRIDLLCMDACLMGSIEVLYELKGLVDYIVASSFSEPGEGFNYNFLKQITSIDGAVDVGRKIIDYYRSSYDGTQKENDGLSLAMYDMSKVQVTANLVSQLGYRC